MKKIFLICCSIYLISIISQLQATNQLFNFLTIVTHPLDKPHLDAQHKGVTNSFLSGLNELQIPYNFNPSMDKVGEVVWVLASPEALKEVIDLKKRGKIKYILAGPNLMVSPSEHNKILTSSLIDYVIVPSDEIQQFYKYDEPSISGRLRTWYAGIDYRYWCPNYSSKNLVLIYWKTESKEFCQEIQSVIRRYGWNTEIIKYGEYNSEQYKKLLDRSLFAVFISRSESQGLALGEAWSMNVPVLAWNPQLWQAYGRESTFISSCPYLTNLTGRSFKTINDLECLLQNINLIASCQPRRWILDNMTNAISSKMAIDLINSLYA